jgi:DNA polymerase-3 subunit epsilon
MIGGGEGGMDETAVIVLDFETSGLSPRRGDRAIEIGAVRIEDNRIVERFQSLINPGMRVSPFIQDLTGITNTMLAAAPDGEEVMAGFADFIGDFPLVAHNAPFDGKFLDAELARIGRTRSNELVCTLKVARRIYPHISSHKLEALVNYKNIAASGVFHRALADAEMTADLWMVMMEDMKRLFGLPRLSLDVVQNLTRISKARAQSLFS